jgi:signal transduction histidine kinase
LRERLFDSMVSVRPGTGGDVPHLGLGLYIVRLIAEFHGGAAVAANRPDGDGALFTITLPLI